MYESGWTAIGLWRLTPERNIPDGRSVHEPCTITLVNLSPDMRRFRSTLGLFVIGLALGLALLHAMSVWRIGPQLPHLWLLAGQPAQSPRPCMVPPLDMLIDPFCSGNPAVVCDWEIIEMCVFHDGHKTCLPGQSYSGNIIAHDK